MTDGRPFPGAVFDALATAADRPVFEHGTREVDGAELLDMVARIVSGLRSEGIGRGDGVAMVLGMNPEAFATMVAAYAVGARVMGIRGGLPAAQVRYLIGLGNTAVITDSSDHFPLRTLSVADLCAARPDGAPLPTDGRPEDVARLVHTSGSTGVPKAVTHTYAALTREWAARPDRWPPAIREMAPRMRRYLLLSTLASQVMFQYTVLTIAAGGTVVVGDPPTLPDAIARLRATATVLTVPRLTRLVTAQRTNPVDLSTLRMVSVSGSPLSPGRHREALAVLGPVIFHGYGQTEAGMVAMGTPADPPGTVGRPAAGVDLEVRDVLGVPVPDGVEGELYVRTPGQSTGYWGDPALSAEVFVDGWVRTRDLGRRDAHGRLRLTGRARDVVIINSRVHYVGPIEQIITEHPDVVEAYVVAEPDDATGEAVHAFVVPAEGHVPDLRALRALVSARLDADCAPARVTTIAEAPVAPSGKPDKRLLRSPG